MCPHSLYLNLSRATLGGLVPSPWSLLSWALGPTGSLAGGGLAGLCLSQEQRPPPALGTPRLPANRGLGCRQAWALWAGHAARRADAAPSKPISKDTIYPLLVMGLFQSETATENHDL